MKKLLFIIYAGAVEFGVFTIFSALICFCLGWTFNIKFTFALWLIYLLIKGLFTDDRRSRNEDDNDEDN